MRRVFLAFLGIAASVVDLCAQSIYQYDSPEAKVIFFDKSISKYVPHIVSEFSLGLQKHERLWDSDTCSLSKYRPQKTLFFITDWADDGNGGASAIPTNEITVEMSPLSNHYDIAPSVERYRHLASHELTHIFNTDKATSADMRWRKFFGTKVSIDPYSPVSAVWSYLSTPRWYNPRWYQEGIACFLETAMGGGVGRALGTYDEMYFRSLVLYGSNIYSAVGLEAEGTSADFQIGATSYLYGTRFVNYLASNYGTSPLFRFYNRTEGSKKFFASQFEQVYGKSLYDAWDEWREYEKQHQYGNIAAIREYPLTELSALSERAMGSVCPPIYDSAKGRLYLAANYQGKLAHISYIDLKSGKERILRTVDGPMMYITCYMTFDEKRRRLIYTIENGYIRGLEAIDADTGRRLQRKRLQRVSNLEYDNSRDCLYGIMVSGGVNHLVRFSPELDSKEILYSFPFGQSVSGLSVSSTGEKLLAHLSKPNGNTALISFSISALESADLGYDELLELDNVSLLDFRFADNDSTLIGSSNYTGVQNIWSVDASTKEMKLLSNVETGLYAPRVYDRDSLIALSFERNGMRPVKLARKELKDANSIKLLGQLVYERNPELEELAITESGGKEFAEVYNQITAYRPIKEMRFAGAYPNLSGFRDVSAFNKVTPVLGYNLFFSDPAQLSRLSMSFGISPWSGNELKQ